ncbi:MAG: 23S rRNA (guanosine(2251)-2'-O)-methyltransferase RlmB [Alphaproteobacteria bacterium]|nr:23S rRNA (guanosine(2251)-2'-O)-methyltransferase RlmB [Alphaproteobacteria bacterium]
MSQKETKFQSKSKKFGGGGKGRGKPAGRGFDKRFEGDKGERGARGGKKPYGRDAGKPGGKPGGDRPRKPRFEDRDSRPGDRYEGKSRDGKPYDRTARPARSGDKRPYEKKFGDKKFGDKKFGDKKPYGKKPYDKKFDDRKGSKPRYNDRDDKPRFDRNDRPRRDYNDRPRRDDRDRPRYDDAPAPRHEATAETRQRLKSDRPGYGAPSSAYLYGAHAVRAALGNPKRLHQRLLVTENGMEAIREAYEDAQGEGLRLPQPTYVENIDIDRLLPRDAVHQGILLDSQPPEEVFLQDILISAPEDAKIMVLDQVTDPHNVGAILRSAAAFGAIAVVMQKLNAPDVTGTLAKSASGAVEYVPIVREVNLSRALEQMKEAGFFCIGLDERGKETVAQAAPKEGRVALVMGAEGDGLRRLVGENCDTLARLPTGGPIASLNVSNAAAVALYELVRERA